MKELLKSRFEAEFSDASGTDLTLTYDDRQLLKEGNYAAVAREKLPVIEKKLSRSAFGIVAGLVILAVGGVACLYLMWGAPEGLTAGDVALPVFVALLFAVRGLIEGWKRAQYERRRLLCELVIEGSARYSTTNNSDPKELLQI